MPEKKLTPAQIKEIKFLKKQMEANGEPFVYSKIAKIYGVSGPTIRRNITPNENDRKPRPPFKYNPEAAKVQRETFRTYQFRAYKKFESDKLIIEKLDSIENKQRYIKELILQDIHSDKTGSSSPDDLGD